MSDDLTCLVCKDVFYEPRTLVCGHSFCRQCYCSWGAKRCPSCKHYITETPKLNTGLENLVRKYKPEEFKRRLEREINPVASWEDEQYRKNKTKVKVFHHDALHPNIVYETLKELDRIGLVSHVPCIREAMAQSPLLRSRWICVSMGNDDFYYCPSNTVYIGLQWDQGGRVMLLQQTLVPCGHNQQDEHIKEPVIPAPIPSLGDLEKEANVFINHPDVVVASIVNPVESK